MEQFVTFQRFNDMGLAMEFAGRLKQLGIYCEVDNQSAPFDISFANNPLEDDVRIKLRPEDFARANRALDDYYKGMLDAVDKDYYLLQFSNEELMEVLARPDEWNRFDVQLAQKLLKDRGQEITPGIVDKLAKERLDDLNKPKNISVYWLFISYLLPLYGFILWKRYLGLSYAIHTALAGIILGAILSYGRKTLPNGSRAYLYGANTRLNGRIILILSSLSCLFWYIALQTRIFYN